MKIRRLLSSGVPVAEPARESMIRLTKINVPKFNGDITNWPTFWEQFDVAINSKPKLTNSEKLAYLRQAVKDGPAKNTIEGLTGSGDNYPEAIACLRSRYDKPRLLHQAHVRAIVEFPSLKEGNAKELRRLHEVLSQHLRALKAMKHEPSGAFITSLIQLKLDQNTMFEWQKHSQGEKDVPHYDKLVQFLEMRAIAAESCTRETTRRPGSSKTMAYLTKEDNLSKKETSYSEASTTKTMSTTHGGISCPICKVSKHLLYYSPKFKALPIDRCLIVARESNACFNCPSTGHIQAQCLSIQQ